MRIKNFFIIAFFILSVFSLVPQGLKAQLVDETEIKVNDKYQADGGGKPLGGFVPCGNLVSPIETDDKGKQSGGQVLNPCNFNYFIAMINKIVNFILFGLAVPIAAIMFCYAGFLLLFSGGDSSKMQKAKTIFINVSLGIVFAAGAWLIIHTISDILGYDGSWIGF